MSNASSSLTDALRGVLLDPAEATALPVHGRTDAAVLVALYLDGGELHAIFTRRRHDLRSHPGEISFPGGRRDEDEDDLCITALREAEEEIGLAREDVELLGALTPVPTVATNFAVYPYVGMIEGGGEVGAVADRGRRGASSCASRTCAPRARAGACITAASRFAPTSTTSASSSSSGAPPPASSATCSSASSRCSTASEPTP